MSPTSGLTGTLLLCDWAEVVGGKLYAQGVGWTRIVADRPIQFSVAWLMHVPYSQTNKKHSATTKLVTEDGRGFPFDQPISADLQFELGRPPGMTAGEDQIVPFAIKIGGITFTPGGYRVELHVDDEVIDTASFFARSDSASIGR